MMFLHYHDLYCLQNREVDTRIILHTIDFCTSFVWVAVYCDDTDVLELLLCYTSKWTLEPLIYTCMHAGHNADGMNHEKYIPVNVILVEVGHDFAF